MPSLPTDLGRLQMMPTPGCTTNRKPNHSITTATAHEKPALVRLIFHAKENGSLQRRKGIPVAKTPVGIRITIIIELQVLKTIETAADEQPPVAPAASRDIPGCPPLLSGSHLPLLTRLPLFLLIDFDFPSYVPFCIILCIVLSSSSSSRCSVLHGKRLTCEALGRLPRGSGTKAEVHSNNTSRKC